MKKLLSTLLIILHLTSISNSATISEPFIKEHSSGDVTYAFDIYCEFDRGQFMYGSDLQRKTSMGGWVSFKLILRDDSHDNESKESMTIHESLNHITIFMTDIYPRHGRVTPETYGDGNMWWGPGKLPYMHAVQKSLRYNEWKINSNQIRPRGSHLEREHADEKINLTLNGMEFTMIQDFWLPPDQHSRIGLGEDDPAGKITSKFNISLQNGNFSFLKNKEFEKNINLPSYLARHTGKCIGGEEIYQYLNLKSGGDMAQGRSSGTAFFISKKGYLLTNNHVVEGCEVQKINYFNKEYEAKIIATDKTLDLALLKANVRPKSFISFSKDEPKKRQPIIIAGYPLGKGLSDDLKINDGRISSLKGFENNSNEITVDIAINPGNSGGPIINQNGQLTAIAVAGMSKDVTEGINFGIKSSAAANFLKSNKISPSIGYMNFSMNDDKLVRLLEESTVYTFCN